MRNESRRPLLVAALLVTVLVLAGTVMASAASLGGLRPDTLGGASAHTQQMSSLTLTWTPTWTSGAWHVERLDLSTASERGFRSGDQVKVAVAVSDSVCELTTSVTEASKAVSLSGDQLGAACGAALTFAQIGTASVAVTGTDDGTVFSNLGTVSGSLTGFSSTVLNTGRTLTVSVETTTTAGRSHVQSVSVMVANASVSDLVGQHLAVALAGPGSGSSRQRHGTIADDPTAPVRIADSGAAGTRVIIDLGAEPWPLESSSDFSVALSTAQHLTTASAGTPGVSLAHGTVQVDGPRPQQVSSGLEAVQVSAGISYNYPVPWTGAQLNQLSYCHTFTITNVTDTQLTDWTVQFDTTLAPMWGWNPTAAGAVSLSNIETRRYDPATGLWTIGGNSDWANRLAAGETRSYQYCAQNVPRPPVNPDLFETTVTVVGGNDWNVTFRIDVTSDSEFYVPWAVEVDFADLVCPTSLGGRTIQFSQVSATPVEGSSTRYLIQGIPESTLLVSASHARAFTFASYSPGPGWQLPCAGGG